jgi:choline dehydrogenase-like flavoprotein
MSEDLPDPESRVTLQGDEIVLNWTRSNWAAHEALVAKLKKARCGARVSRCHCRRRSIGARRRTNAGRHGWGGPGSSVVTPWGRSHDHANLWIADASVLPTSAAVNPSLTIAAHALRVADALEASLRCGGCGMTGTALVTGGQQGIGLGIAQALHGAGWRVALMSERERR